MQLESIKTVLMSRDHMSSEESDTLIEASKEKMLGYLDNGDFENAGNICQEFFGLEPDYLFDLMV